MNELEEPRWEGGLQKDVKKKKKKQRGGGKASQPSPKVTGVWLKEANLDVKTQLPNNRRIGRQGRKTRGKDAKKSRILLTYSYPRKSKNGSN